MLLTNHVVDSLQLKVAFDMFDIDQTGSLDRIEVRKLVRMCQGKKSLDSDAEKILKKLDQDGSGDVTLEEFQQMVKNTRSLLFPAFKLQRDLREKFLGPFSSSPFFTPSPYISLMPFVLF